jgi:dihydrofolate reductase
MRKVIADEFLTLDGVVQGPSSPEEDPTGGFRHGGWHPPYLDETSMAWVVDNLRGAGGYLLGRGTYERFAAHWPSAPQEQQVLAEPLNTLPKYVVSTTLQEPLGWRNSTLLRGDLVTAVHALRAQEGRDLHVIGSPVLVRSLLALGLLDELRLMIDPVVVGGGKRLFGDDGAAHTFRLADSRVTGTGAVLATYIPLTPPGRG